VYRVDESAYGAYQNREWAVPVPTMLGMMTQDLFQNRPLTRDPSVFDPPSAHSYPYVWRGAVRELEEVDRGRQVFAAVRLDARLVRSRDDSVLWAGTARLEKLVPEGTMPAIVAAISDLAAQVITQLQDSARVALGGPAGSAAMSPR
jgi:cholesterol transport system auxiliary component